MRWISLQLQCRQTDLVLLLGSPAVDLFGLSIRHLFRRLFCRAGAASNQRLQGHQGHQGICYMPSMSYWDSNCRALLWKGGDIPPHLLLQYDRVFAIAHRQRDAFVAHSIHRS